MRQWRIGSFSMGLILILLGVGLIIERLGGTLRALDLVITWWPLALILLGAEILAASFLIKNEQFKLKYDGWSIFMMIVLFFFCLGSYSLSYSGVIPQIREAITMSEYNCALPEQEADLAGIKKVIISSQAESLEIRSTPGEKLSILGQATIQAVQIEEAKNLARQSVAETNTVGDMLYVHIGRVPGKGNAFRQGGDYSRRTVFVPAETPLEVFGSEYGGHFTVNLDSLSAPWSIENAGPVKINLVPDLNLTLTGTVPWRKDNLAGNMDWKYTRGENPDREIHEKINGEIKIREGRWPLTVFSDDFIEANLRP